MSNSNLVVYTKISPNRTSPRTAKIKKITIHHMAGNLSVETCGKVFEPESRRASSNYGIDSEGRVGMYVEEADAAWTSSSTANDSQAVTIEVANDEIGGNWHVSDKAMAALIELCIDICKRNGIKRLNFTGDTSGNLTMHKWFKATSCPGPYLESKFPYIAEEVNKELERYEKENEKPAKQVLYCVQIGAYKNINNASKQMLKAQEKGFDTYLQKIDGLYKVQVGAYSKQENATKMLDKVKKAGFSAFISVKFR